MIAFNSLATGLTTSILPILFLYNLRFLKKSKQKT
jgi:hypothetical protein